jgi:hypothetical protein
MRYLGPEKLEIIRLVEQSHLPVRRTLAKIGIPPTTFKSTLKQHAPGSYSINPVSTCPETRTSLAGSDWDGQLWFSMAKPRRPSISELRMERSCQVAKQFAGLWGTTVLFAVPRKLYQERKKA